VDARKIPLGEKEAVALTKGIDELVVSKGKKTVRVNLKEQKPAAKELAALLLGPTGNLRAPTGRIGRTLIVGFNEDAYRDVLKSS
jgi:arsenate reductase-like glutaredoxin family protein